MAYSCHSKVYTDNDHRSEVLTQLYKHLEERRLCDVTLVAGIDGVRVPAHRVVLSAASEYFSTMFASVFREASDVEVTMQEVDGEVLQMLVEFCYTGRLVLNADSAIGLLSTAHLLQLRGVVVACCDFLAANLDLSTWSEVASLSERLECGALLTTACNYIATHFLDLCTTEHLLELTAQQLAKIISSDELQVPTEECVFQAVVRWLEYDPDERGPHAKELLQLVRFPLLEPDTLSGPVKAACTIYGVQELYIDALERQLLPVKRATQKSRVTAKRSCPEYNILRIPLQPDRLVIDQYNPTKDEWELGSTNYDPIGFSWPLLHNEQLIFFGPTCTMRFNFDTKQLSTIASYDEIEIHSAVILNGVIHYSVKKSCVVKRFNLLGATPMPDLVGYVDTPSLVVMDGKLYAFALDNGKLSMWFNPATGIWSKIADFIVGRRLPLVCGANGCIYVFGGTNEGSWINEVERYDNVSNRWTGVGTVPQQLESLAVLGENIYGIDYSGNRFGSYNVITNLWTDRARPCIPSTGSPLLAVP